MRVFNQEKTQILENVDLKLGHLIDDKILISPSEKEEYHYEYKVYKNGGKDRIKVIDKPFKSAQYEIIQVYVPFNTQELLQKELQEIDKWFKEYDNQVKQYQRCQRIGIEFDKDIVELDNQAKSYQERIREIKDLLKQEK